MSVAVVVLLALVAALAFTGLGYLLGVRLGGAAREALRHDLEQAARGEAEATAELGASRVRLELTLNEMAALRQSGTAEAARSPELRQQIDSTIKALLGPLLERDSESRELREAMSGLLGPMAERERLGLELTRLDADLADRAGLPKLLTAIAARAGFSTVLITDDAGLPIASNDGARGGELLAASASLLLTLVDRIVQHGAAAPLAAVLRDTQNQNVLHRIFRVGKDRFVLTAVASGGFLPPDVLDPTLVRVERLLASHSPA